MMKKYLDICNSDLICAALESLTDSVAILDHNFQFLYFNPSYREEFKKNYEKELTIGARLPEVLPAFPEAQSLIQEMITQVSMGEEARQIHESGDVKLNRSTYEMILRPLRNENNQELGYIHIIRDISRQKQTEAALKQYQLCFEFNRDIVFLIRYKEGRIVNCNPAMARAFGFSREELLSMTIADLHYPEDLAEVFDRKEEAYENGILFETLHRCKDGTSFPVEVHAVGVQIDAEPMILGIVRNINERKQAIKEMRFESDLAQQYLDIAGVMMGALDREGRITLINKKGCEVLGYSEAELLHQNWFERCLPEETRQEIQTIFNQFLSGDTKSAEYHENTVVTKSGERRFIAFHNALIQDPFAQTTGLLFSGEDITDRKKAEAQVKNIAKFPEENPNPILRVSRSGELLYANAAGAPLLKLWKVKVGQTLSQEWCEVIQKVLDQKQTREEEITCNQQTYLVQIVPILDGGYVNIYGRDITGFKKLEEQYLQAQKMEAIGRLAGGVAHDFNNLLTVILGYGQIVLSQLGEDNKLIGKVKEMTKAGERAAALTRQLLAFSRKQVFVPKVVNLNIVVGDMEKMLQRLIGEDIHLRTHLSPDLGLIKTDPAQIDQVIMNLVINSRDAMPMGGQLSIETGNVELDHHYIRQHADIQPGHYVMLAISDTGCGIDKALMPKIFEPFFTTKKKGKGTGLGLSTVYGIVKQSGGNIFVYSEVDKGTTFKMYFPRIDEREKEEEESVVLMEATPMTGTILLVEDEDSVRSIVKKILIDAGFQVLEASQFEEALQISHQHTEPIHLLITDVIMPGKSGKELADHLGKLRPEMKVLFVSGYTDNAIVHHGVLEKGLEFLQKPFTPTALLHKIRMILESARKT